MFHKVLNTPMTSADQTCLVITISNNDLKNMWNLLGVIIFRISSAIIVDFDHIFILSSLNHFSPQLHSYRNESFVL